MRELVGQCTCCRKEVYCLDGFLNGVYVQKEIYCFHCYEEYDEKKNEPQN